MTAADLEHRYRLAKDLGRRAGQLAMQYYGRHGAMGVVSKGVHNVVTKADQECEKLIAATVLKNFPQDTILGEESGFQNRGSSTVWIVDPIDGTSNFVRQIPLWCVSIGIIVGFKPVVGVICDPVREELYHSLEGRGAFRNDEPVKVSDVTDLKAAQVGLGFSHRQSGKQHAEAVASCLAAQCDYRRLGTGSLSLACVADGRLDGYWENHMNSWDAAAGLALVRAAGGWCNDYFAGDGLNSGNSVLAATPVLVEPLRKLFAM
jgi:myo-inositol-1(or 4)-monophosphatase